MKNIVFALFIVFFMIELNAKQIKPAFVFKSKGFVNDFVFDAGKIYVANDEGSVEIFDLSTRKRIDEIFIDPIFTTKQVWKNVKILSVDRYNGKTLMVSTSKGAYRNVWLHDGKKMKHIVKLDDKISIKEARFIEDGKFIFGTLSYEMILYNTSDNYNTYKSHIEQSSFSDLELSEDKKTMITASESGIITVMN
ncbi:MAG: nitrate reductase, partial [Campylobacterota bacterium]|nr:nitrate reductase [Campylobacterota bacterium]